MGNGERNGSRSAGWHVAFALLGVMISGAAGFLSAQLTFPDTVPRERYERFERKVEREFQTGDEWEREVLTMLSEMSERMARIEQRLENGR